MPEIDDELVERRWEVALLRGRVRELTHRVGELEASMNGLARALLIEPCTSRIGTCDCCVATANLVEAWTNTIEDEHS